MTSIPRRAMTNALVAALEDAGLTVHRGRGPGDPGGPAYVVIYSGGRTQDGTADDPNEDANQLYHLKSTGDSLEAAEDISDAVRDVLLGTWAMPAGYTLLGPVEVEYGNDARPDLDVPSLWTVDEYYRIIATPVAVA